MSLDEMIMTTSNKLGELQARVEEKSGLGTRYKELVMAKLAFFKDKILDLLKKQKGQLTQLQKDSKTKMKDLNVTLTELKDKEKDKDKKALDDARKQQDELKKGLSDATSEVNELKRKLAEPNPDVESLRASVNDLTQQLAEAKKMQEESDTGLREARRALDRQSQAMTESTEQLRGVIELIEKLIKQVDSMSITNDDLELAMKKLGEIEDILTQPEKFMPPDDGDFVENVKDMFQGAEKEGAAFVQAAEEADKETEKILKEQDFVDDNQPKNASQEIDLKDIIPPASGKDSEQTMVIPESTSGNNKTRKASEQGKMQKKTKVDKQFKEMKDADGIKGGKRRKTHKRRRLRTSKKGGYVHKKKDSSRKMKKKKGKKNKTSTTTSSSSSKTSSS